ncbi:MAG: beta-ketoacyl-ACP synthase III [Planctomycetota bacterium]
MTSVRSGGPSDPGTGVRLAGTAMVVPEAVLTNQDLAQRVDTSDAWIVQRTGIRERHVAGPEQDTVSLASDALRAALDNAGWDPPDLDLVLVATITPGMLCPSVAARVVDRVGATPAGAMDLAAACAGFLYGLNLADAMIRSGSARRVAVVGSETMTRAVDPTDRRTCILFGDGAGAALFEADPDPDRGCRFQAMRSAGENWAALYLPEHDDHVPEDRSHFNGTLGTLQMNGREVFKIAVHATESIIDEALEKSGLTAADLSMVIAHQSNARILESTRRRLGLPADKLYVNIDRYGNTSAASIPIGLHELRSAGRVKEGDWVLFTGVGGGMCWGASTWKL